MILPLFCNFVYIFLEITHIKLRKHLDFGGIMLVLCYVLAAVYTIAINVYGALLLKFQKNAEESDDNDERVSDGKLLLAAALGGAIGIYAFMFVFRYRLKSLGFMILMPMLGALTLVAWYLILRWNFGVVRVVAEVLLPLFRA